MNFSRERLVLSLLKRSNCCSAGELLSAPLICAEVGMCWNVFRFSQVSFLYQMDGEVTKVRIKQKRSFANFFESQGFKYVIYIGIPLKSHKLMDGRITCKLLFVPISPPRHCLRHLLSIPCIGDFRIRTTFCPDWLLIDWFACIDLVAWIDWQ